MAPDGPVRQILPDDPDKFPELLGGVGSAADLPPADLRVYQALAAVHLANAGTAVESVQPWVSGDQLLGLAVEKKTGEELYIPKP